MREVIKKMNMDEVVSIKLSSDEFIELYNNGEAILLDIRYPFETKNWGFEFSTKIPLDELPDRISELPKDKLIVCACPENFRSNMACLYLKSEGFNAKLLNEGLKGLAAKLSGKSAKKIS